MLSHELLEEKPVYQELLQYSRKQRLPKETPLELLRFLALVLNRFPGKVPKECGLSPSTAMDQLWHHILLNTRLSKAVDALLGGEVEHSTSSIEDTDAAKIQRQLAAMNLMEQSSWKGSPSMAVWAGPGSLLQNVKRVQNTGGPVYRIPPAPTTVMEPASQGDSDHKRRCTEKVPILLVLPTEERCVLRVDLHRCYVRNLFALLEEKRGLDKGALRIHFDGEVLRDNLSLAEIGVEKGDVLDVTVLMRGC